MEEYAPEVLAPKCRKHLELGKYDGRVTIPIFTCSVM